MNNNLINTKEIQAYLKENKLSIVKFCKICKISPHTYKKIMANEDFNLIALFKIAKAIKIPIHKIFNAEQK